MAYWALGPTPRWPTWPSPPWARLPWALPVPGPSPPWALPQPSLGPGALPPWALPGPSLCSPSALAMFTLPSLHKPDRYDEAIKEVLDAGITLKTRRLLTADFVGTSKPMSKDEFHEFLQKRIASYEESIQSIDEFLDRQASHDNIETGSEQSQGCSGTKRGCRDKTQMS